MGTAVEMTLKIVALVAKVVDERALLNEFVFLVDAHVLHLFLGRNEMLPVFLLNDVCPLVSQLSKLVLDVGVIENCEFRAWGPCEVPGLSAAAK